MCQGPTVPAHQPETDGKITREEAEETVGVLLIIVGAVERKPVIATQEGRAMAGNLEAGRAMIVEVGKIGKIKAPKTEAAGVEVGKIKTPKTEGAGVEVGKIKTPAMIMTKEKVARARAKRAKIGHAQDVE